MKEIVWEFFGRHMGYSEAELQEFRKNPAFVSLVERGQKLNEWTVVVEVVKSEHCFSGHKVGDKFYFDPFGNLLTKMNPKRICIYALEPLGKLIFAISEKLYAGEDPNSLVFRNYHCFDVGLGCGGWGEIVCRVKVEKRK
jgi:uncharacterized repeat protein (TIGR04076 family)